MPTDEELVRRCLKGHPDAMRELIDRFQPEIFALCFRLLGHRHDAEDVAQEVFLRIFRSLNKWDSSRPLRPWIFGITVNRCRTCISKRGRIPEPTEFLQDVPSRPADSPAEELTTALQTAINTLRDDYREVFILFHEQGQPYDEIAVVVGRPVGTVKTWLHRARVQVLNELKLHGHITDDPLPDEMPKLHPPTTRP